MIHPIIDEYYSHNPSHVRSSGFAVSKGLVSDPAAVAVGEQERERERVGEEEMRDGSGEDR